MRRFAQIASLFLFAALLVGCTQPSTNASATATDAARSMEIEGSYGAAFTPTEIVPAKNLTERYDAKALADTVRTTLRGQVNEVCQAKGCWMTIAAGTEDEMMVKFKDYGFFMPKDISGREVVMNGMAYYQVTPVDELRHYAEDAGKSPEEIALITDPKRELRFLADGVKLIK